MASFLNPKNLSRVLQNPRIAPLDAFRTSTFLRSQPLNRKLPTFQSFRFYSEKSESKKSEDKGTENKEEKRSNDGRDAYVHSRIIFGMPSSGVSPFISFPLFIYLIL
ncbi:hypothetical protein BB560_005320 [Smittium megazygosporum]|uniref:Uncharacterized protein n=1 Tax=Smittium megazygosporum TaxID=133381 RepID=A0A2T9Z6R6_9FUNG|nr:hypothetical protein BB560_005320 [Smittium megazygosporum]